MVIKGKNITLRKLRHSDADCLLQYGNNPKIARNLRNVFPSPYTPKAAKDWIDLSTSEDQFLYTFAITKDDKCIGMAGLEPRTDVHRHTLGLGYWIGEPFWGKGLVSEAVDLLCQLAFTKINATQSQAYFEKARQCEEWTPS